MMNCQSIFVTATGTDVGKTYVSGLIVKKMREFGLNCGYYKPALSGAIKQKDGTLLPGDCEHVIKTSGLNIKPSECVSYCFEEAVSPHLAAVRAGLNIQTNVIVKDYKKISENYDYMVVEGAGGITCPFNLKEDKILLPDVINALELPVLIVADGGLGTINSVILTVEYAKSLGLTIAGIILNNYEKDNFMHVDNKKQIEILTGVKVIAEVAQGDDDLNLTKENLVEIFLKKEGK